MDEGAILERLRSIATSPSARGLADDVALLDGLVLTHDSLAEGVHFRSDDPAASVGWKLAAVNASDLAGKGATPAAALLSLAINGDERWEAAFLDGLEQACVEFGLPLVGGDTIALPATAPRVVGLTAIGRAGPNVPARDGGRPGDCLWLVGTVGDSAAGLALLGADPDAQGPLVEAYRRPRPMLAAGQALAGLARAMMDVSDGLLLDCARLAAASGCAAEIRLDHIPLSAAFRAERGDEREARLFAATGGDDYALLAAIPADWRPESLCLPSAPTIQCIGRLVEGSGMRLSDAAGPLPLPERLGYVHQPD